MNYWPGQIDNVFSYFLQNMFTFEGGSYTPKPRDYWSAVSPWCQCQQIQQLWVSWPLDKSSDGGRMRFYIFFNNFSVNSYRMCMQTFVCASYAWRQAQGIFFGAVITPWKSTPVSIWVGTTVYCVSQVSGQCGFWGWGFQSEYGKY